MMIDFNTRLVEVGKLQVGQCFFDGAHLYMVIRDPHYIKNKPANSVLVVNLSTHFLDFFPKDYEVAIIQD